MNEPRDGVSTQRFPRRLRMCDRNAFKRVLRSGARASDALMLLRALPNGLCDTRLGLIVGRRCGGAVRRNSIKRTLRSAFRIMRRKLPVGLDLVCTPRPGAVLTYQASVDSLVRLSTRVAKHLKLEPPSAHE